MQNFGDLKETVRLTLGNRKDLDGMIPTFVALAERRIYRTLRVPANETSIILEPAGTTPLPLPRDYLEAKMLLGTYNNRQYSLERLSDLAFIRESENYTGTGKPKYFARVLRDLHWHPAPDVDNFKLELIYWQDFSGQMTQDSDTNEIMRIAPGLYLYGALMEAELYIGHDDRVPLWNAKFAQSLTQINEHAHQAEHSGSELTTEYPY